MSFQTHWFTSSKGGTGKTLFCLNCILALIEKIPPKKNILIIDANSVNTDLFNIIVKTKYLGQTNHNKIEAINEITSAYDSNNEPVQNVGLDTRIVEYKSFTQSGIKTKRYIGLVHEEFNPTVTDRFKIYFTRDVVPFETFPSGYDFVNCMANLIDKINRELFEGYLDYVFIDTNIHIGNLLQYKIYSSDSESGEPTNDYAESVFNTLNVLNSRIFFFWTWSLLFDCKEYEFIRKLDDIKKIDTRNIFHVINMYSFIGNFDKLHCISKEWEDIAYSFSSTGRRVNIRELLSYCNSYLSYIRDNKMESASKSNYIHLDMLGRSFTKNLKSQRPSNLIILPEFYHEIKGYAEMLLRNPYISIEKMIKFFKKNLLTLISEYERDLFE